MHPVLETTLLFTFLILMIMPGLYGLHLYILMLLNALQRGRVRKRQQAMIEAFRARTAEADWPMVTTQLPLYNELTVAERVIRAAAAMDYPANRHQIQVLDDSTDETRDLVDRVVEELRDRGTDIEVVRRPVRKDYKAGALAEALPSARGEFVGVFDSDFVPERGFLRRMIPLIAQDPKICCVQGRWSHLNAGETWITEALSLGIDGHFGVEQGARAWNGFLLNFNGTGGVWRKAAIEAPEVGGWSGDTITEDLDLSYRAQLAGWRILYHPDERCPAEIPADVDALKAQQRRWATGSIQTARKLLGPLWRSKATLLQKVEGTIHLTQYCVNLWMLLMVLVGQVCLLAIPTDVSRPWIDGASFFVIAMAAAPSIAYWYARWSLERRITGPIGILKLMVLGLGLSVNNTIAVITGLFQRGGEFVRTPKSGSGAAGARAPVRRAHYSAIKSHMWILELVAAAWALGLWIVFAAARGEYIGPVFILLFATGFFLLGWGGRPSAKVARRPKPQRAYRPARLARTSSPEPALSEPVTATASSSQ